MNAPQELTNCILSIPTSRATNKPSHCQAVAEEFGVHQIYSRNGAISYIMWFREAWVCPPGWLAWFFVRIFIRWRSQKMVPIAKARGAFTAFLRAHC